MTAVIARIFLRYAAAALVTRGLLGPDTADQILTDPDVEIAIGAALGAISEGWLYLARKFGWQQ